MLKNKMIGRKIRNIVILLMAIVVMIGAYRNIYRSRAEDVIEIGAIAVDNYGYLVDEQFILEGKQIEEDRYEIELPESINTKKINQIVKVTLEDIVPEVISENAVKENAATENTVTETPTEENNTTETPSGENTVPNNTTVTTETSVEESTTTDNTTATPEEPVEENTTSDSTTVEAENPGEETTTQETPSEGENTTPETPVEENTTPDNTTVTPETPAEENTTTETPDNTVTEDATTENVTEENVLEIVENKIYLNLTKEQIENKQIKIEVVYDIVILEEKEDGTFNKILLTEKSEEERKQLEAEGIIGPVIEEVDQTDKEETNETEETTTTEPTQEETEATENIKILYNKILKYEDEENNKIVELKGYLPIDAQIQVEEATQEQLAEIFGDAKIDSAYDIKIIVQVVTTIPADEADPNAEPQEIVEIVEINPEEFGETCEVSITDANIAEKSQVYHVKEDNTYEQVNVKENTEGNVSFEAETFSLYVTSTDEGLMTADATTDTTLPLITYTYNEDDIDKTAKTLKVVFSITDENFANSTLALTDLTIKVDGETVDWTKATREFQSITDVTTPATGKQYTLLLSNLEQTSIASGDNHADYSGYVTIEIPAGKVTDTAGNANEAYTINVGAGSISLPSTDYTTPYLPTGFSAVDGTDLSNGLTVEDSAGNQFVWIEVPTNLYDNADYNTESTEGDRKPSSETDYDNIEYCLREYVKEYNSNDGGFKDEWYSETQFANEDEYYALKQRMLKSVYKNGGFYIGKYETGIADTQPDVVDTTHEARTEDSEGIEETPVIQANAYPYNFVTCNQAQTLASGFASGLDGYESSLMFGVQWDLVLKHLETSGAATFDELETDSTEWGNYINNTTYTTNAKAKYSIDAGETWVDGAYNKTENGSILLSTGASTEFEKGGIYDLGGNLQEWTLEHRNDTEQPCILRGGAYDENGSSYAASYHSQKSGVATERRGFRVALFEDGSGEVSSGSTETTDPIIVDVVDPLWTTENLNIDTTNQKVTVDIVATDKYFDAANSALTANDINVYVDGNNMTSSQYVNKELSAATALMEDRDGDGTAETQYGIKYTLTITDWIEPTRQTGKVYREWSGETVIAINEGAITDQNGNTSKAQKLELGQVDFINPEFTYEYLESDIDHTEKTVKIVFTVADKNYKEGTIGINDLTILIDGEQPVWKENGSTTGVTRTLTSEKIEETRTNIITGATETVTVGYTYTLLLSELEQDAIATGKNYLDYSGIVTVEIPQGKITDKAGNTNDAHTITVGAGFGNSNSQAGELAYPYIPDGYTQLEGTDLSTGLVIQDASGNQFVWVEVPQTTTVYPTAGLNITQFTDTDYTNIENDLKNYSSTYNSDSFFASGTDIWGNALRQTFFNSETEYNTHKRTMLKSVYQNGGFYVGRYETGYKSDPYTAVIQQHAYPYEFEYLGYDPSYGQDISESFSSNGYIGSLMYGVQWDLILKYLETSNAATQSELKTNSTYWGNYLNGSYSIRNSSAKYWNPEEGVWYSAGSFTKPSGSYYVLTTGASSAFNRKNIYDLAGNLVELTLETGDSGNNNIMRGGSNYYSGSDDPAVIRWGWDYTDSAQWETAGWTVGIRTVLYKDDGTGAIEGTDGSGEAEIADVVDPLWEIENLNRDLANNKITLDLKVTDKYFKDGTLTSNIKILENGVESTTATMSAATDLTETRDGETVKYGEKYSITITGFDGSEEQIKVQIPKGTSVDQYGNDNELTDLMIYNVLLWENYGGLAHNLTTRAFLGESVDTTIYPEGVTEVTPIERQYIERVEFVNSTVGSKATGVQRVWDVSAQGDDSILAWTSQTTAPYTVYIGSDYEIFANRDSRNLFACIGYDSSCDDTQTIVNLNLLNTSNVTDMYNMFAYCGYNAMTSLTLPESFDTGSVTNMGYMFSNCGYTAMTSLTLPESFNTSSVTDMLGMFSSCGYTAMTSLTLPESFNTGSVTKMSSMFYSCGYTAMTSLTLPSSFDTSSVTSMSSMFLGCGFTAMTSLTLPESFNTGSVTNMGSMFYECGYTAMTSLTLPESFNTSSVTDMSRMFRSCGYAAMTSLTLPESFNTGSVTDMSWMFWSCGYAAMTSLTLPESFNTSSVTDMNRMFANCGYSAMTSLTLPESFNTGSVTNMGYMFSSCGYTAMTSLTLPESFNTSSVTDMRWMFRRCGYTAMSSLDLGPAFTNIPSGTTTEIETEYSAYIEMFENCGKDGELTIYAPESIYKNQNAFKFNSTDTTETPTDLQYTRGTIVPKYKPEWTKVSSTIDTTTDPTNPTLTVTVKGSAYQAGEYASNVTSTLATEDITVFVDGVEVTSTTNPTIVASAGTTSTNATSGKTEATHTIVLSNLIEAVRQAGIPYKEWSGNISLKIAGRGQDTSTYTANVLTDAYGNQSMMETDQGQTAGTWINVTVADTATDRNTTNIMFMDYIKPEFTYEYSETDIDYDNKTATVVFSVVDKYFASSSLTVDQLEILIDGAEPTWRAEGGTTGVTRTLTKKTLDADVTDATTNITYKTDGSIYFNGIKIGERYELVLSNLEQNPNDGFNYSGIVSVTIPAGMATDKSGNTSNVQTITVGVDKPGNSVDTSSLNIGDFVNYDAGIWLSEEIAEIKVGPKSSLVSANGTTNPPNVGFQFGGFQAGSATTGNRNGNATPRISSYDYLKNNATGEAITGWRIFDINDDGTITLISAGNPEDYYHPAQEANDAYKTEYILTGNVNSNWSESEAQNYQPRDWKHYINEEQKAQSATVLTKSRLDEWFSKYIEENADTFTNNTFSKIYSEPYLRYQNIIDNYSNYILYAPGDDTDTYFFNAGQRIVNREYLTDYVGGLRILVTLSPEAILESTNETITITGGNMTTYGGNQTYNVWDISNQQVQTVDVVDPIWELGDVDLATGTIKLKAKDKYFSEATIDEDAITVLVNGVASDVIVKDITTIAPTDIKETVSGVADTLVGKEYTLQLSNFIPEEGTANYITFTPTETIVGGTAQYREENGGDISIEIAAGTIKDQSGNLSEEKEFYIGKIDTTMPEVYDVQKTQDATGNKETFIFNVTDRNYDSTDLVTKDELTIWIDGVQVDSLINNATLTSKEIKASIDGTTKVLGHQYTLEISNIAETLRQTGKDYLEYSGTIEIKIAEDAAKDLKGNTLNPATTTISDFVDYSKPELRYIHQTSDIDAQNDKYTMTFEITDKYYESGELTLNDLTILMQNGRYKRDENGEYVLDEEGDRIPVIDDLKALALAGEIDMAFNATPKYAPVGTNVTNADGDIVTITTENTYQIGHTYTLQISNLNQFEKFMQISAHETIDYSGVITVEIPADKIVDISDNKNVATTITSGIDLPKDLENPDEAVEVDLIRPIWSVGNKSVSIDSATDTLNMQFKLYGTDTYFDESKFTVDDMQLILDGTEVTDNSITKTLVSTTTLTEDRIENGINVADVQYGISYEIKISGIDKNVKQIKFLLEEGILIDQSGNQSIDVYFIPYNTLKLTSSESEATSPFLGESVETTVFPADVTSITPIQRQDIEKVEFVEGITGSTADGVQRVWDVSAQGDDSILAWTSDTEAPYTVYIGSAFGMYANVNSKYLFSYIGYGESSTATKTIENLYMLNTSCVWNMSLMFNRFGYRTMTSLNLPLLDTSNVTNMFLMFNYCGYTAMTALNLGFLFDTSNVTNMSAMFQMCGYTAMTSLTLPSSFDTSGVTDMSHMFYGCGYAAMTSLTLPSSFDTSSVTDMSYMFCYCGYTAMTTLNLGTSFNTSNVTDMSFMFNDCGYTAMTNLDLSSGTDATNTTQFNTSNVTNMSSMFQRCGYTAMTTLNLGTNFNTSNVTDMSYMFIRCGYTAMTSLDLSSGTDATNTTQFNTSNVTNMKAMFASCGYTAMTTLNLGTNFNTSNVTDMRNMFSYCGYRAMASLDLSSGTDATNTTQFNTSNVTNMSYMFQRCGYTAMTTLNLGTNFNTSNVTDMTCMFINCGYTAMTTLDLGTNFNTSNVTIMRTMFQQCGYTAMTSLDLGDKFDTSNVTDMRYMFCNSGHTAMTRLDLGPAFTNIPSGTITENETEYSAYIEMFENCGKDGELTIYAPESIYSSKTLLKTSSSDTTTISVYSDPNDEGETIDRGATIIPTYKPEWEHTSVLDTTTDPTNPTITITLKGTAYESQTIDSNVKINYASDVTSTLEASDIQVFIDGVDVTNETRPQKVLGAGVESTNAAGKKDVTHTFVLSNLEEATRRAGIPYKEWSGNISLKIAGRGQDTSTYTANVLVDEYGNQSMMETDEGQTAGTWIDVTFEDAETNKNTNGTMFADFIKPEFTYLSSETTVVQESKTLTVVFYAADKYFDATSTGITLADFYNPETDASTDGKVVFQVDGESVNVNVTGNSLTPEAYNDANGNRIGTKYTLVVKNLQKYQGTDNDGFTYSGIVGITIPANKFKDLSGNVNDATTITVGVDETDGNPNTEVNENGQIVDVVDPVWKVQEKSVTTNASGVTSALIKLLATDKYFKQSTLTESNIQVLVDGENKTSVLDIDLSDPTAVTNGNEYTFSLTNFEETYEEFLEQRALYAANTSTGRVYREFSGPVSIIVPADTAEDNSGNKNEQLTIDLGTIDTLKPEVVKVSSTIDPTAKTQTIVFDITDKYLASSTISTTDTSDIHVLINGEEAATVKKQITNIQTLTAAVGTNTSQLVGYRYTLVLSEFEQSSKLDGKQFIEWSGNVSIKIDADTATDENGLKNAETTFAGEFNDFIQPKVEKVSATNNTSAKTQTIVFTVTDKYLDTTDALEAGEITVKVDGETTSSIQKSLTSTAIKYDVNRDGTVAETEIVGYTYTLVLSNFEQLEKQTGKDFIEWSGNVTIEIAGNAVKDTTGNINGATATTPTTLDGAFADFITPYVEKVSATPNASAGTETIVFNVMDKYLDTTDPVAIGEITVYVDGEPVTVLANADSLTKVQDFTATVNGDSTHIVGQQYQLVLSGFEQLTRNAKGYTDWSGTVEIKVAEGAAQDLGPNGDGTTPNVNEETTIVGDFIDFIKPNLKYTHSTSDIDHVNKKYTMTFDITDKYYSSGELALNDLTITMQNGQYQKDANGDYVLDANGNRIAQVYDLIALANTGKIDITFGGAEKSATFRKTVGGAVEATATSHVIGHTYTLTIENLEQLEIATGLTTLDYSGVITVEVAKDKIVDTSNNKNDETTITTGVSIANGVETGTATTVDVVDPIWERISSSADAIYKQTVTDPDTGAQTTTTTSTATIKFRGTDTYYVANSVVATDNIKVFVNGSEVTDLAAAGITKTLVSTTPLTEERLVNGVNTTVQYGAEYEVKITGFPQDANQVKIQLPKGAIVDQNGNDSEVTDLLVYNVLKSAETEVLETSEFLGESVATTIYPEGATSVTPIQRQNIEQVIFVNSTAGSKATGVQRVWDVSAQGDDSIIAWTSNTSAPYTVYIGSDYEIFANQNSSFLFSYIGSSAQATEEETIKDLSLLNINSVTDMSYMFNFCGTTAMTSLELGTYFDTSDVIYMTGMFQMCGATAMTTLDLGESFDTSNVVDMSYMFNQCGTTAMTTFDLGEKFDTSNVLYMDGMFAWLGELALTTLDLGDLFDTSNVTSMNRMFLGTGYTAMTSLDLGNSFNTSNVTDMGEMFALCGYTAMTSLDLGDEFDTSKVTNMYSMFNECGATKLASLDLGNEFDTKLVTNMAYMFWNCGTTAMTSLDLGPAFTKIPDGTITDNEGNVVSAHRKMFDNCGKQGALTVYAPEAIYSSQTAFKLNSASTTTITPNTGDLDTETAVSRGTTIIPKYKPEWTKVSSTLDTTGKKLTVTVKGSAYNASNDYASNVTSTLAKEDIKVYVNGVEVTSTTNPTITVSAGTESTNGTSTKKEITHTIELTNLEEAARRGGVPYKELSGNISIKIGGRGKETSTYTANVLVDEYGNQNMMETDEGQTAGTWINVTFEDTATDRNTNGIMFTDFIKPEFTYLSSETTVDKDNKILTVKFSAVDKYIDTANSSLALSDLTFVIDGETIDINVAGNTLTKDSTDVTDANGNVIGAKYTLVVKNLQKYQGTDNDGFTYSGIVGITIPANKFKDLSGNVNDATTITVGVDETDGNPNTVVDPNGDIVDVVDPIWELGDVDLAAGTIKLKAIDKYFKECTIDEDAITVYVNGVASTAVVKDITTITPTDIKQTVSGVANTVVGKEYTLQLSNITLGASGGYITFTPTETIVGGTAQYRAENGGDISIKIAEGTIKDNTGNENIEYTFDIGNIDNTQPEVYDVQKTQDASGNKETFIFNVTDRNYDSTDLITIDGTSEITVWMDNVQLTAIPKPTTTAEQEANKDKIWMEISNTPIKLDIDGVTGKILGHQYTLVLSNIAETTKRTGKDYLEWSGTLDVRIASNAAKDLSQNTLNTTTTTISDFVDYLKPQVEKVTVTNPINTTNKTYTMSFNVIDKYLDTTNMVTANEITVYVDGVAATAIAKPTTTADQEANKDKIWMELTSTPISATMNKTVNGTVANGTYTIGHTYTLVLSNFEQSAKQAGKNFMEWSGTVSIEIAQTAVNDKNGTTGATINTLDADVTKRTVAGDHVDFIKPVVEKVSSEKGTNTETIYFNVIDKYLDTTDLVTDGEITVYVDGEVSNVTKTLTRVTANDVTATINGTSRTVSHQYQLVLSDFEQSTRNAKDYTDWSGTVTIEIAQNAVKDTSLNTLDADTAKRTIEGDFVDFIKPNLKYTHSITDIDLTNKKYTMTFDVTDKYYSSGELSLSDLTITMQNGQYQRDANGDYILDANGNKQPIVYNLMELANNGEIDIDDSSFTSVEKSATFRKTVSGAVEATATSHVIGHTYTLTIEGLEQVAKKAGLTTLDYSGVITVEVAADKIVDTSNNKNNVTYVTSGVNIENGTESGTATEVDVVDPIWERISSSANAIGKTATITLKGTDTYFDSEDTDASTLTSDEIEIYVNGEKDTSLTPTIGTATELTEDRIVNGTATSGVQYGVQYTITITGFDTDVNQVKVKILEDAIKDESGNGNKNTELIVYNVLKTTSTETAETSAFLGESVATTIYPEGATSVTPIQRQNIEQVIFVNSTSGSKESGVQRVWDVSAQDDDSIIAWTSQTSAPYTVYIGSDWEIFANQNSSYLFSYIGYAESCTSTEVVTSLSLLNENYVTNMEGMFNNFGYRKMTTLDLEEFNTSNVTNMANMFAGCGNLVMTSLDLGTQFDTSKVTNMSNMFNGCGQNAMTEFRMGTTTNTIEFNTSNVENMSGMFQNFGHKLASLTLTTAFDTTKVTNMSSMFSNCGYTSLASLTLPTSFNTANVTDMSNMFNGTGYTAMTSLNLGNNFNTSKVTNMAGMFMNCGYTVMTSLDLGNLFDTSIVTNMRFMFYGCGDTAMTVLDLGPAFTNIASGIITENGIDYSAHEEMFEYCGKEGNLIIYAPESIYANKAAFKFN